MKLNVLRLHAGEGLGAVLPAYAVQDGAAFRARAFVQAKKFRAAVVALHQPAQRTGRCGCWGTCDWSVIGFQRRPIRGHKFLDRRQLTDADLATVPTNIDALVTVPVGVGHQILEIQSRAIVELDAGHAASS